MVAGTLQPVQLAVGEHQGLVGRLEAPQEQQKPSHLLELMACEGAGGEVWRPQEAAGYVGFEADEA